MINFSITRILNSTSLDNHKQTTTKPTPCYESSEDLVVKVRKAVIKLNKMNTQGKYKVIRYRDNGQLEGESNWKDGKKDGRRKGKGICIQNSQRRQKDQVCMGGEGLGKS